LSALKCQQIAETNELSNLKRFRYAAAIFSYIPAIVHPPASTSPTPSYALVHHLSAQQRMHKENTRHEFAEPK